MLSDPLRFCGGGHAVTLAIRRSPRARTLRLRVDPRTADVLLTVPRAVSARRALAWAEGQRAWVERALAEIPMAPPLGPGAIVPLQGEPHVIDWRARAPRRVAVEQYRLVVGGPRELIGTRLLRWLRQESVRLLEAETREYAKRAGVEICKVSVGDPVSRWGSCSSSGAIRYSWRLILAPSWVRKATVAHEVAHRVHMNHAPAFHALAAELFGSDPKPAGDWLKRNGASLHRFGRS